MRGFIRMIENSNYNLREAISKTKDENLKIELEKRLESNKIFETIKL